MSPSQQRKPNRYELPLNNMVGAMVVVVLFVLAFVIFRAVARDNDDVRPPAVDDYASIAAQARSQHQLRVFAPSSLPAGWQVNASQKFYWTGSNPRWAFVANNGTKNMGIQEGLETPPKDNDWSKSAVLKTALTKGPLKPITPVTLNGDLWSAYTNDLGYYALVRSTTSQTPRLGAKPPWWPETVVVYGTASAQEVQKFALSLSDHAPSPTASPSASPSR